MLSVMATRNSSARHRGRLRLFRGEAHQRERVLSVLKRKCGRMRGLQLGQAAVVSAGNVALASGATTGRWRPPLPRRRRRAAPKQREARARARGVGNDGEDQLRRAPRGDGAESDDDEPLQRERRARQRCLERADDEQPHQHAGQGDAGAGSGDGQPVGERRRAEDHADGHRAMHEEQRAQDDADMADVDADSGAAPARRRGRRDDAEDRRAKPVERDGPSPRWARGRSGNDMLIGDGTPPIESRESWRDTCSGLSPTDARPWGSCCSRDDDDPCGSPRLPRLGNFKIHVREPVREKVGGLVGAVHRADERARQALHGKRDLRQAPLARRHRRQPGPCGDARRPQGDRRGRPRGDPARPGHHRRRDRTRRVHGASTSRTCTSTSRRA